MTHPTQPTEEFAPPCPFFADGTIDLDALAASADSCVICRACRVMQRSILREAAPRYREKERES